MRRSTHGDDDNYKYSNDDDDGDDNNNDGDDDDDNDDDDEALDSTWGAVDHEDLHVQCEYNIYRVFQKDCRERHSTHD